jgi:hypothetical protein
MPLREQVMGQKDLMFLRYCLTIILTNGNLLSCMSADRCCLPEGDKEIPVALLW